MHNILMGIQSECCLVYMDIIIYRHTIHEHLVRLTEVEIQLDKCEFLRKKFAYLGHTSPTPTRSINFRQPTNQKEVKYFLGLEGY